MRQFTTCEQEIVEATSKGLITYECGAAFAFSPRYSDIQVMSLFDVGFGKAN
jgi:hypothetical protein